MIDSCIINLLVVVIEITGTKPLRIVQNHGNLSMFRKFLSPGIAIVFALEALVWVAPVGIVKCITAFRPWSRVTDSALVL